MERQTREAGQPCGVMGTLGEGGHSLIHALTFYRLDISHHKRFRLCIYGCTRSSWLHVGGGSSLLAVGRPLMAVASHVVGRGL